MSILKHQTFLLAGTDEESGLILTRISYKWEGQIPEPSGVLRMLLASSDVQRIGIFSNLAVLNTINVLPKRDLNVMTTSPVISKY
jgi:hypothetical protein